jgi:predicted nucleic acid-binding protein
VPFVLDASITAAWALSDEDHPDAELAQESLRSDSAIAPSLWWFEVRNALIQNERRSRISKAETAAFLAALLRLPITIEFGTEEEALLRLARAHRLTVYDAAYLELAKRKGFSLATLDSDLIRVARAEGIPLLTAMK